MAQNRIVTHATRVNDRWPGVDRIEVTLECGHTESRQLQGTDRNDPTIGTVGSSFTCQSCPSPDSRPRRLITGDEPRFWRSKYNVMPDESDIFEHG